MLANCRRLLTDSLNAVFPTVERDGLLEQAVSQWYADRLGDYCPRCGETATPAGVDERGCPQCRAMRLNWARLYRLGAYRDALEDWIHAMKFEGRWAWADALGLQLARAIATDQYWLERYTPQSAVVCPVPMHVRRRWSRGYNQAQRMAASLAKHRGLACVELLQRHRATPPQTAIHPNQRETNVRHAFKMASKQCRLDGVRVALVDDVKTSGGTLRASVRTLREAGAAEVICLVAAVADHQPQ